LADNEIKKDENIEQEQPETELVTEEAPAEEQPKTELELLKEQYEQLNDRLLRTFAEYDNFRKRAAKEKESIYPDATANAVEKFLPIYDNFERALACECSDPEFKKGIEMIFASFKQVLQKFNVEEIGAVGETFNPALHNAVMHVKDDSKLENEIVEVFQKGYKIGDRVLRYSMVKVAN